MKKLIKINLKQKFALMACVVLLFILCRPLMQLMQYENTRMYSNPVQLIASMEEFFLPNVFMDFLPTLATSGIIALVFFSYLFSKKRVDLYHSIPVDRKKLFAVNYISGVIVYLVATIIEHIICILIAAPNHYMTGTSAANMIATIAVNLVHFLYGYSLTIFAIMLTGHIVVAVLGSFVISLIFPVAASLITYLYTNMYVTYMECTAVKDSAIEKFSYLSPITSYTTFIENMINSWHRTSYVVNRVISIAGTSSYTEQKLVYPALILPLIVSIAFATAAYYLYLIRPSEAAGKTIAFKKSQPFIRIPIVMVGGLIGAWFFSSSVNGFRTKWIWLGVLLGVLLTHCVLEIVFKESFKAAFTDRIQFAASLIAVAVIVGVFYGDLTGYDKAVPDRDKIESAAIYLEGIDNNLSCMSVYEDPDNPGCYLSGYDGFINYNLTRPLTDSVSIDKIYAISQIGVSCVDDMITQRYESDNDDIAYAEAYDDNWAIEEDMKAAYIDGENKDSESKDLSDEEAYKQAKQWMDENGIVEAERGTTERKLTVNISYKLKSGRTVLRKYDIPLSKALTAVKEIYKTEEFNRVHFDIFNAIETGAIRKADVFDVFGSRAVTFTDEDCKKFLEAYLKDLSEVTIDKISELPIGRVAPSFKTTYGYDEVFSGYYIYPSYTNTMNYLKSLNVDTTYFTSEVKAADIQSIYASSYNLYKYEDGDNLYLDELVYSPDEDEDAIKELAPTMLIASDIWSNEILYNSTEEGIGADVSVYFSSDKGLQRQATVAFKDGKLPEKIKKDIAVGLYKQYK